MYFMTDVFGAPKFFIHGMRLFMRTAWRKNESVAHTLPYDLAILSDWSVLKEAASIDVPVLVIGGARSSPELQEAVKTVVDAIPRSQQRMLDGQSHNVSMKTLAPVLVEFFLGQ
jgi:pimeloyl-ACP methyl ester carboxylesterase